MGMNSGAPALLNGRQMAPGLFVSGYAPVNCRRLRGSKVRSRGREGKGTAEVGGDWGLREEGEGVLRWHGRISGAKHYLGHTGDTRVARLSRGVIGAFKERGT